MRAGACMGKAAARDAIFLFHAELPNMEIPKHEVLAIGLNPEEPCRQRIEALVQVVPLDDLIPTDVRDATAEENSHGHPHGPGTHGR